MKFGGSLVARFGSFFYDIWRRPCRKSSFWKLLVFSLCVFSVFVCSLCFPCVFCVFSVCVFSLCFLSAFSLCVFSLCFLSVFSVCFLSVFSLCVFSQCFLSVFSHCVFSLSLSVFSVCVSYQASPFTALVRIEGSAAFCSFMLAIVVCRAFRSHSHERNPFRTC